MRLTPADTAGYVLSSVAVVRLWNDALSSSLVAGRVLGSKRDRFSFDGEYVGPNDVVISRPY